MQPDTYGCAVVNRFCQLLDDDADPIDLINKAQLEKDTKNADKNKSKHKKNVVKESQKERRVLVAERENAWTGGQTRPGFKEMQRDLLEAENSGRKTGFVEYRTYEENDRLDYSMQRPPAGTSYDADSGLMTRAGFRGARGESLRKTEGCHTRGKRVYERHSGATVSPDETRGGRGPWNWGSIRDSTGYVMEVTTDAAVRHEKSKELVEGDIKAPDEEGDEVVVQVAMEMSLDEWKALQELSRPKVEFNIRKAEDKVPSKARVIHKSKPLRTPKVKLLEEGDEDGHVMRRPVNDITARLDINFGSLPPPTRGGRGRGRGGRGGPITRPEWEVGTKTSKADVCAPNPDDPEDFPALALGN